MNSGLNRRQLLQLIGAAAFTTLQLPAADPDAPLFFTKNEFATLDCLTELIIPADDHSPGAHAAGVAAYIDRTVAEAFDPKEKTTWQKGLATVDQLSQSMNEKPFLKASPEQQTALLKKIAANEKKPETEAEKFFTQLKQTTAFAYYSSSIGIHQDIEYKGNVILDKFVGYEAT
jgi:gluconate 2-dehydrogenase gamma chain